MDALVEKSVTARGSRRVVTILLTGCASIPLIYLWAEFGYRMHLYYDHYHAKPYANHVPENYFTEKLSCARAAMWLFVFAAAMCLLLRAKVCAIICLAGIMLSIAHPAVMEEMRASKKIVTYLEWAEVYGP